MEAIKRDADDLIAFAAKRFIGGQLELAKTWNLDEIQPRSRFVFSVINNQLQLTPDAPSKAFREYLSLYDLSDQLRAESGLAPLSMPILFLPVNRTASHFQSSVSLATHNDFDYKRAVEATSSRAPSSIATLAVGRLASRFRLLLEADSGKTRNEFYEEKGIQSLTLFLKNLGYGWKLDSVSALRNEYEIELTKQDTRFRAGLASSGEKELLTYLFGIFALNIRDAIIVIDEPELHLHPKWQAILLNLFEQLAVETRNQFLLATHSPIFVSPASIQYVSRVYSEGQRSRIVRLENSELPDARHLFSIVNSLNNERIFFCDKVILVEGISDRLFFEAILKIHVEQTSGKIYEVVSVGGKGFFEAYKLLLQACRVPYAIVADLDYVNEVGPGDLKGLFVTNEKKIRKDVVENVGSRDGADLVKRMEEALESHNLEDLKALWGYIRARHTRLREDLSLFDRSRLKRFILSKRNEHVFILSKGALEAYLPEGLRGKSLDKLIRFLNLGDFWDHLSSASQGELKQIVSKFGRL
jgi:hypothetical protein